MVRSKKLHNPRFAKVASTRPRSDGRMGVQRGGARVEHRGRLGRRQAAFLPGARGRRERGCQCRLSCIMTKVETRALDGQDC